MRLTKLAQTIKLPNGDIKVLFAGQDGKQYGAELSPDIIAAVISSLVGTCHSSVDEYNSPDRRNVKAQPLEILAAKAMVEASHRPAVSLLTTLGVEIILLFHLEMLRDLKDEIGKLVFTLESGDKSTAH